MLQSYLNFEVLGCIHTEIKIVCCMIDVVSLRTTENVLFARAATTNL